MSYETQRKQILKKMARIGCMEKGTLTEEYRERIKDGKTLRLGPYYKHQCWDNGHNVSRRIPVADADELNKAVDGYHEFQRLADEYAKITIEMTRESKTDGSKKKPGS